MKNNIKKLILIGIISIFIEVCFFNFESIRSKFYEPYSKELNTYYETEFKYQDGIYVLNSNESYSTIEIYDVDSNIENIYVDFEIEGSNELCNVEYFISDEGNEVLYLLNNNTITWNNDALSSKYIKINSYGTVHKILIKVYNTYSETIKINSISLNVHRPLFISKIRLIVMVGIMYIASLFLGKNNILDATFNNVESGKKKLLICILIFIQIFISVSVGTINDELVQKKYNEQYKELTNSLINGKVNLDIDVDEKLLKLENPYDLSSRLENGIKYKHDTSFFKGKYYVYFGVAPVIIYYLPYKLITGIYLCDYIVNIINFIILSISIIFLFKNICEKYFKNTPIIIYGLLSLIAINACGSISLLSEPRIYTVPILMALAYACLGVCLWVNSKKENKINNWLVALGSLSIGIAIASRPQFGLFAFFAFVIFFDEIKNIRHNIVPFIFALVPFIIVGSLLMYYNYIRFESPFDFGANYNLTLNDMTHRGFRLDRILDGLFYYLFQPQPLQGTFPYVSQVKVSSDYVGNLIKEYSFGGLFFIHPVTSASLLLYKSKKNFKDKKLFYFGLISIIFGLIIVVLDTQMAGLLERYFADFSIYFIFASLLVILSFIDATNLNKEKLYKILFVICELSFVYCFFRLFAETYQPLSECSPKTYYKVLSLFKL